MYRKIKIVALPKKVKGGAIGFNAHASTWPISDYSTSEPDFEVGQTLSEVPEEYANLEAEKGEVAITNLNNDGIPEKYNIQGKSHAQGGTPLNLPNASFIFSKDKSLKIKDKDILATFGITSVPSGGISPADIAKKYDINKYKKALLNPLSDRVERESAELMIENYNRKLAKLALIQESMKGFPQGIPAISMSYAEEMGISPEEIFSVNSESRGSSYPIAQKGKQVQGRDPYTNDFWGGLLNYYDTKYKGNIPPEVLKRDFPSTFFDQSGKFSPKSVRGVVPKVQSAVQNAPGAYGRKNWIDPSLYSNFQTRQKPFLDRFQQEHSREFDPKSSDDIKWFEKAYNTDLKKYGFSDYDFGESGMFGELTWSAPGLSELASPPPASAPEFKAAPISTNQMNVTSSTAKAPFWLQDIIQTAGAFGDLSRVKKYNPWQASSNVDYVDPVLISPERQLSANAEQLNIGTQGAATFTGPQAYNSRFSQMAGESAKNAADILGGVNNANVGILNQAEELNTNIYNNYSQQKAAEATQLFDKQTIANQQFDNSRNQARQGLRQSYIDAITNQRQTQVMNSLFDNYQVNPLDGGSMSFKNGSKITPTKPAKTIEEEVAAIKNQLPGVSWEVALKIYEANKPK